MEDAQNDFDKAVAEAAQAQILREQFATYARLAVKFGHVNRDWVNARLNRLGVPLVTGYSEYRLNIPITGVLGRTINASSRAEALDKFNAHIENLRTAGQTACDYDVVYQLDIADVEPTFFSGPEDAPEVEATSLDLPSLKASIRNMLKEAVATQGWGLTYAAQALQEMGLEALPPLTQRMANVPVSGVAQLSVPVFEGDDEATIQASAQALVARIGMVHMKPEEVGQVLAPRSSGMELNLVDDEEEYDD